MAGRGGFSSRFGFIAAAAGSAVGLGNIWKFPFEVGSGGGGAFVLMYLFFCFVLCYPVMLSEIAIGRKTQRNPVGAFNALGYRRWNIIGKLGILSGVLILSFYNVVAGWAFGYFIELAMGQFDIGNRFVEFIADWHYVGAFSLIFMFATAFIVSQGISSGVEKASKILMPALVIMIALLTVYALTLPNAFKGVEFYLIPDFSKISANTVFTALGQGFFSLSLGMGALITYGSYVSKDDNIAASTAIILLCDVGIAFIAGLMMFPFVFYQGLETDGGAGLIFQTLPGVFETLGGWGIVIGASFFLLLSFAALTSTVSLLEVPVAYVVDEWKVNRKKAVWVVAGLITLVSIPSMLANGASNFFSSFITYPDGETVGFMTFVENLASDTFLPLGGLIIALFVGHVWRTQRLDDEIAIGAPNYKGSFAQLYVNFAIKWLCPLILGAIFIVTVLNRFFGVTLY